MIYSNKRIFRNSALLSIRSIIVILIGLYTSRVLLGKLGVEDYGVFNIVAGVVLMFDSFRTMFTNAIQRFLNYSKGEGDDNRQNQIFNTSIQVQLLLAVVFVILTETIGLYAFWHLNLTNEQFEAAHIVYQLTIVTTVVSIMNVPYEALVMANERMDVFAWLSLFNSLLRLVVVYLISIGPFNQLVNYAILLFAVTCIIRVIMMVYCHQHFVESRLKWVCHWSLMAEMTKFAGWNFLGFIGYSVTHQGVNYLLNLMGGVVVNAARSITYQVMGGVRTLVDNAGIAFRPQTNAAAAEADRRVFYQLLGYHAKVAYTCYLMMVIPVLLFARQVIGLWLGEVPEYVVIFLLAISPYYLLRSLHQLVNQFFISIGEMMWYQVIEICTMVMIIPLAWMLLKKGYGFWTVFVGMSVVEVVNHAGSVWLAVRKYGFPLRYFVREVYLPFGLVSAMAFAMVYGAYGMGVSEMKSWFEIIGVGVSVEGAMLVTIVLIVLRREERKRLVDVIRERQGDRSMSC